MKRSHFMLLLALGIVMASCGSDDNNSPPGGPILAKSVMGTYNLTGAYATDCFTTNPGGGNVDVIEIRVVDNLKITGTTFLFSTSDASCGGLWAEYPAQELLLTMYNQGAYTVLGWSNGATAPVAVPAAVDGVTAIEAAPVTTILEFIGTEGGKQVSGKMGIYVDDTQTGTDVIWYRSTGNPAAACDPGGTGSEQCLLTVEAFHRL